MTGSPPTRDLWPYFRVIPDLDGPLNWTALYGNDHPVVLDIGCGRGMFLVKHAEDRPDLNILGLEIDYREGRHGAARLKRRNLDNARVIGGDARIVLEKYCPPASVHEAYVLFPDPWWKRKHRRRRIFTDTFVDLVHAVLQPNAPLNVWSDVQEYFLVMAALMNHHPGFTPLAPPAEQPPAHDLDYHTSFERKRRQAGAPIYRGRWQKISPLRTN